MASPETYPKIARRMWWLLRERLKKSVPTSITPTLINSLVPMTDASARSNVIAPLRELGLIDEQGKPTPLAERWRHDDDYQAVCHEIRAATYPHELVEAFPDPDPEKRDAIRSWFMKVGKVGEDAARRYTDTYLLLSDGDHTKATEKPSASSKAKQPRESVPSSVPRRTPEPKKTALQSPSGDTPAAPHSPSDISSQHRRLPAIHIDVQVHISPDTPPDQIDRIFESMAKHLGQFIK